MSLTSTVILEVSGGKAADLVSALSKRDYINVVNLDREEKKIRKVCPCCGNRFPREMVYTVTAEIVEALLDVIHKMKISKSVVLVNKDNPISSLPEYELARCTEIPGRVIQRAKALGLLCPFHDGSRLTYFVTGIGLDFMASHDPISPSTLVVCNGEVVEQFGSIMVKDVKFKDRVRRDRLILDARRYVSELPRDVVEFVKKGQISLI